MTNSRKSMQTLEARTKILHDMPQRIPYRLEGNLHIDLPSNSPTVKAEELEAMRGLHAGKGHLLLQKSGSLYTISRDDASYRFNFRAEPSAMHEEGRLLSVDLSASYGGKSASVNVLDFYLEKWRPSGSLYVHRDSHPKGFSRELAGRS